MLKSTKLVKSLACIFLTIFVHVQKKFKLKERLLQLKKSFYVK